MWWSDATKLSAQAESTVWIPFKLEYLEKQTSLCIYCISPKRNFIKFHKRKEKDNTSIKYFKHGLVNFLTTNYFNLLLKFAFCMYLNIWLYNKRIFHAVRKWRRKWLKMDEASNKKLDADRDVLL